MMGDPSMTPKMIEWRNLRIRNARSSYPDGAFAMSGRFREIERSVDDARRARALERAGYRVVRLDESSSAKISKPRSRSSARIFNHAAIHFRQRMWTGVS